MKMIYVCSPLAGDIEGNRARARAYCEYVVACGHIPVCPQLYLTEFLDDTKEEDRKVGMFTALEWLGRF